ncbi:MAG TPA: adenylate cyclase [Acidimicrobiia bacterium]|nr:adenylate cyclase [Acidimicrobiia bacterium]
MTNRFTDEQLSELLGLIEGSDSVELKLTLPDSDIRSAVHALGIDPLDAEIRQVVFFDTPDLALNRSGVVVRARRIQGGRADTVVKLRPIVPEQLSSELRASPNLSIEVDAMPGGFVCSASMKGRATSNEVRQVILGRGGAKRLFTKEQRSFYRAHAPEDMRLGDLMVLGPVFILKLRFAPERLGRKMVAELWLYPDGSRIVELSTKCLPGEAFQVAAETRVYLADRGIDLSSAQQTKTKAALEYFAALAPPSTLRGSEQLHGSD